MKEAGALDRVTPMKSIGAIAEFDGYPCQCNYSLTFGSFQIAEPSLDGLFLTRPRGIAFNMFEVFPVLSNSSILIMQLFVKISEIE